MAKATGVREPTPIGIQMKGEQRKGCQAEERNISDRDQGECGARQEREQTR